MSAHLVAGIDIIDTMVNFPDPADHHGQHQNPLFSRRGELPAGADAAAFILGEMDRYKIATAVINLGVEDGPAERAARAHGSRFIATYAVDPNLGMEAVRALEHAVRSRSAKAAYVKPALLTPQVPINNRMMRLDPGAFSQAAQSEHRRWNTLHQLRIAALIVSFTLFLSTVVR